GLAIVLLVISLSGCSAGPPAHGTSFLVALDTNSLSGTVNHVELLGHTREVLRQRLEDQGFRFVIEAAPGECLLVKVSRLSSNDLAAAREVISKRGLLEFRRVHTNSEALTRAGTSEPGYELLKERRTLPNGKTVV